MLRRAPGSGLRAQGFAVLPTVRRGSRRYDNRRGVPRPPHRSTGGTDQLMRTRRFSTCAALTVALTLFGAAAARAQYTALNSRASSDPATGERYHVEAAFGFWNPTPTIIFSSEQFGIPGTPIDLQEDLDAEDANFREFRLVLRPARKHKFRLNYIPIKYEVDTVLRRNLVFNGNLFSVGLPIQGELKWDAWRFGYEYDFIYRDRGFLGIIAEAKYTSVSASIASPLASEFAEARAPIPALGLIGRGYILPNVAITGEFTAFRIPDREDWDFSGRYYDFDIYGTVNFTNNLGVQGGYRRLTLGYQVENDFGDFTMKGLYVLGVARF